MKKEDRLSLPVVLEDEQVQVGFRQVLDYAGRNSNRPRVRTVFPEPSETVQSDRNEAELRFILQKYNATDVVDHLAEVGLVFRDVSQFADFRDVMVQSAAAREAFMTLPPEVRAAFNNDVASYMEAATDPAVLEEYLPRLQKIGVVEERPVAEPPPVITPPEPEAA